MLKLHMSNTSYSSPSTGSSSFLCIKALQTSVFSEKVVGWLFATFLIGETNPFLEGKIGEVFPVDQTEAHQAV
jgi:hypothetical protein